MFVTLFELVKMKIGTHVMSLFLLTSAHYPGIRPRNLEKYLEACMPQWQVSLLSTVSFHHWPLIEILC